MQIIPDLIIIFFFSFHNRVHLIVKEKDKECGRVLKTLLSVVEKRILIK